MSAPNVPTIRGALVSEHVAYALSRVLDRDEIAERLDAIGLSEKWREETMLAVEAIDIEAATWRRDADAYLQRKRTALGSSVVPGSAEASSSDEMTTTVTTREAAEALNVSERRVRQLIDNRTLPATRDGWQWRVDAAAVAERANGVTAGRGFPGATSPGAAGHIFNTIEEA